jgi:hypothetical protein
LSIINSSILFIYDGENEDDDVKVKLIDFAHTQKSKNFDFEMKLLNGEKIEDESKTNIDLKKETTTNKINFNISNSSIKEEEILIDENFLEDEKENEKNKIKNENNNKSFREKFQNKTNSEEKKNEILNLSKRQKDESYIFGLKNLIKMIENIKSLEKKDTSKNEKVIHVKDSKEFFDFINLNINKLSSNDNNNEEDEKNIEYVINKNEIEKISNEFVLKYPSKIRKQEFIREKINKNGGSEQLWNSIFNLIVNILNNKERI